MTAIPLAIHRARDTRASTAAATPMTMAELELFYDGPIPASAKAAARSGRGVDRQQVIAEINFFARQTEFHRLAAMEWDARGDVASAQRNRRDAEQMERQRAEWVACLARLK